MTLGAQQTDHTGEHKGCFRFKAACYRVAEDILRQLGVPDLGIVVVPILRKRNKQIVNKILFTLGNAVNNTVLIGNNGVNLHSGRFRLQFQCDFCIFERFYSVKYDSI